MDDPNHPNRSSLAAGEPPTRTGEVLQPRWRAVLPTAFVVLCLLALLAGPLVMLSRIQGLHEEIQVAADPARAAVVRIQYLLARQTSALRGYWISGDPEFLRRFEQFAADEEAIHARLETLTSQLGPDVVTGVADLRARSIRWHEELADDLQPADETRAMSTETPFEIAYYMAAIDAATRLDAALVNATVERQTAIRAAEDRMRIFQIGLVAIALLAAASTAYLGLKMRSFAAMAETRRLEAEHAFKVSARAVRAKSRLMRGVTHDVKNPLGAADGYAELLQMEVRGSLTAEQSQMVEGIRRAIQNALGIIDDLLEMASAERGSLAVRSSVASLPALVEECVEEYRGAADAAGHTFEVDLRSGDFMVRTDPARVMEIIGNLLSNAIKHTPAGGVIRVETELMRSDDPPHLAVVRVVDSGPGIPPEHHERIFQEFERLPGAEARGHGLGLAIARRIARLIDGDLWVESDGVSGTAFSLRVPTHPGNHPTEADATE